MKIVIISQVIFPRQSPRSFRATELAKYFAKQGHEVLLYAVLGGYDYSVFERETGIIIKSLGRTHFATLNSDGYERNNLFDKILRRVFGKYFEFPNIELMWKTEDIIKQLKNVDLLITIAIPHPIHWGAAKAKRKHPIAFPKVWISDCGDPYMGNSVDNKHPAYFQKIEDFWGSQTDYITIPVEEAKKAYSDKVQNKIIVIPQGFDFIKTKVDKSFVGNDIPRFAYAGAIYPGYRDPTRFLQYLCNHSELCFEFVVYTKNKSFFEHYKPLLGNKLIIKDYVSRETLLWELSQMDFLVNIQNNSEVQSPSKLIDYYLTTRPIIDITTDYLESNVFEEFMVKNYEHQHLKCDVSRFDINVVGQQFLKLAGN